MNGVESPIGSAEYDPSGGDRIWWDYRDWTAAMRVPTVVGSWPEPFVHGFQGHRWPAILDCRAAAPICEAANQRLSPLGVKTSGPIRGCDRGPGRDLERRAHESKRTPCCADGPDRSGVFARFVGTRKPLLEVLNQQGQPAGSIGKGGGLVAALRPGDGPPTWVVTGTDAKGVAAAAGLLGDALRNHYALATQPGATGRRLPVRGCR